MPMYRKNIKPMRYHFWDVFSLSLSLFCVLVSHISTPLYITHDNQKLGCWKSNAAWNRCTSSYVYDIHILTWIRSISFKLLCHVNMTHTAYILSIFVLALLFGVLVSRSHFLIFPPTSSFLTYIYTHFIIHTSTKLFKSEKKMNNTKKFKYRI